MTKTPNARGLIGAIKAGQAHLGWDDATYRGVLSRLTGKTSATQCSLSELQAVREYMHEQGYPRKVAKHGRKPRVAFSKTSLLSKIEALLADAGRPWPYAESMAKRMFKGRQAIEWLTEEELTKLLQALAIDAKRHGRGRG
ncbi:gp16 family protein [Serratia sp. IR-2025]